MVYSLRYSSSPVTKTIWGLAEGKRDASMARRLSKGDSDAGGDVADIGRAFQILLGGFEVLQHERSVDAGEVLEVGLVVQFAAPGNDLDEVDIHFRGPGEILGVAGDDVAAEFGEELIRQGRVVVELLGAIYGIADIDVDGKGGTLDGLDELQVAIGTLRHAPTHDFQGEFGAFGFDGVNDLAAVFHGGIEETGAEVIFVGAVPDLGVEAAGDVDAAAGADGVGKGHAGDDVVEIGFAGGGVGVEHILPGADFGDEDVFGFECGLDGWGIFDVDIGAIGGGIAEAAVLAGEFTGVVGLEEDGSAEANGEGGSGEGGGGGEELTAGKEHLAVSLY